MHAVMRSPDPIPKELKSRTRAQFLAVEKRGKMTHDELYWLLYRAALDRSSSLDAFYKEVVSLLNERLGSGAYILTLNTSENGGGSFVGYENVRLPNSLVWSGQAGILPGIGRKNAVTCCVFWG